MLSDLNLLPADPIYGMQVLYKEDSRPNKCNLSIGVCLNAEGKILRFSAVDRAYQKLMQQAPSKEYLPISGLPEYTRLAETLVCGDAPKETLFSMQSVGGTGALYLAAALLKRTKTAKVFVPESTWANHKPLFEAAGHTVETYPYYDKARQAFDFTGLLNAISTMPQGSAIILQASCHNPTGIDPSQEQFQELSQLIKKQKLFPIFDLAYLGFGNGLEDDASSIRTFLNDGHEMAVATSFSKSFGLYNDRIGLLTVRAQKEALNPIASHLKAIARSCYSSPPAHGAFLIKTILQDQELTHLWQQELGACRERLHLQRTMLFKALQNQKISFGYEHLLKTKGLFCLFDLAQDEICALKEKSGIYLSVDGRIALAAILESNVASIAEGFATLA